MNVILLHHLIILWIRPNHFCHVSKTHILSGLSTSHLPFTLCDDRANLLIDPCMHVSNVSVSEAHPQIVLVVQERHLVPAFLKRHLPFIADLFELVHQLLIIVVVQHGGQEVKAAVADKQSAPRLPELDLLPRLSRVETIKKIIQLHR